MFPGYFKRENARSAKMQRGVGLDDSLIRLTRLTLIQRHNQCQDAKSILCSWAQRGGDGERRQKVVASWIMDGLYTTDLTALLDLQTVTLMK
jgi:hypothetical protein